MGSSTPAVSSDVAELKDMVRALILDKKNQTPASASVKAIEQSVVWKRSISHSRSPKGTLVPRVQLVTVDEVEAKRCG
ncbi:hypothetical protein Tco_1259543, partial [Tanacetum coccineum]